MSDDLHEVIKNHPEIVGIKEEIKSLHEADLLLAKEDLRLAHVQQKQQETIDKITTALERTATKDDIDNLQIHFDRGINNLLRDALNALPAKYVLYLTMILVAIAAVDWFSKHGYI